MDIWFRKISRLTSHPLAVPAALLCVTALAYGLSLWRLGFYWDDQPISWIRYQLGTQATAKYFSDSRPLWGLLFQLTGYLLPLQPAYWQLFAMLWRWAGVTVFWLAAARMFPGRRDLALFLSLLLLVYPGFNQQWVSYVYSHFFVVLFFLLISWYLMLRGWTVPALIFSGLNLIMLEYFFMLEFIRPIIIWRSLRDAPIAGRERLVRTLKSWLPYLAVILLVVLYRSFVYSHPGFGYSLTDELTRAPVHTLAQLAWQVLNSWWVAAVAAWAQAFQFPNPEINGARTTVLYVFVVLAVGALTWFVGRAAAAESLPDTRREARLLLGLGALLLLLGGVPYWVTNLPVTLGFPANRATLSFMLGACFLLAGLFELLPGRARLPLVLVVISLSAGRQFLWSVDYGRAWQSQKSLFWQMVWRAPGLAPNTLILMNEELDFNADNSLSAALNWIYAPQKRLSQIDFVLFYPTNRLGRSLPALEPDLPIRFDYWAGAYEGNTSQAVAFYYSPPACLHVLDPEIDDINRFILADSLMRDAAKLSSTAPILTEPVAHMPEIYSPEPTHGWCYHFQRADLARQLGDWESVVDLGDQAFRLDDYPNDPTERFVFIEGYAHMGDWSKALKYSQEAHRVSPGYVDPLLCRLWTRIEAETAPGPERAAALDEVRMNYTCPR